jgi:hypothetical protein
VNTPTGQSDVRTENRAVLRLVIYVFGVILVSSFLLALNTGMFFALSQGIKSLLPSMDGISQLIQFANYIGPIILLYLEWYAWDVISSRRLPSRAS